MGLRGCRGTREKPEYEREKNWLACILCEIPYGSDECKDLRKEIEAVIEVR